MWYFKFACINNVVQSTDPERFEDDATAREAHANSLSSLFLMGPYPTEAAAREALDEISAD